jgi:hypothetical protein
MANWPPPAVRLGSRFICAASTRTCLRRYKSSSLQVAF